MKFQDKNIKNNETKVVLANKRNIKLIEGLGFLFFMSHFQFQRGKIGYLGEKNGQ